MHARKLQVKDGRLVLDEPTDMPNGTELYVVPAAQLKGVDVGDDLDDAERAALDESIRAGIEDMEAGRTIDAKTAIAQLRSRP